MERERVILANAPRGAKGFYSTSIEQNGYTCGRDATHFELDELVREVEGLQHFVNKIPLKSVIGFFKIYFYGHVLCFPLLLINRVDKLLGNNDIVQSSSPWNKGSLHWRD